MEDLRQERSSLPFNLVLLNMKPTVDSMAVKGSKWLDSIHISQHIWLTNQNA